MMIPTPNRDERIYPNDKLLIIGTDEQDMTLQKIVINSSSPVYQQTIRDSGIRERSQGLVVGIERKGERILNPDSNLRFENEDIVWIVGNHKKIPELLK
jgi:CPA2 family monovalent cation:H+ antiporter-2